MIERKEQGCSDPQPIMTPTDPEPMMSLNKFTEQMGRSKATIWRYRKAGMLVIVNTCGRQYISRAEIARFNARAVAGEFARDVLPIKRTP